MSSEKRFSNKIVVTTASTAGIGLSIAQRFAREGAKVVISSRTQTKVDLAVESLHDEGYSNVIGVVCNVRMKADMDNLIKTTIDHFGGVDILISNAALSIPYALHELPDNKWDLLYQVNVKASFVLSKAVIPYMKERGGGSIVMMSSIAAYAPLAMAGPYSASKTALIGLCKVLAKELGQYSIRVNCIAPGLISTQFSEPLQESEEGQHFIQGTALKRCGTVEEISGIALFLCSKDASYITGQTMVADGGAIDRL